jgi:hypothetical protein
MDDLARGEHRVLRLARGTRVLINQLGYGTVIVRNNNDNFEFPVKVLGALCALVSVPAAGNRCESGGMNRRASASVLQNPPARWDKSPGEYPREQTDEKEALAQSREE